MSFLYLLTWRKIRAWLLGVFLVLFVIGVVVLKHTGQPTAPLAVELPAANGENFAQYLVDHWTLLGPFFERHRTDLITQGEPLLLRALGDVILINMAIGWVVATGMGMGFSHFFAKSHAKPWESIIYSTWRIGLDMIVFLMGSFGLFGLAQTDLPLPITALVVLFVLVDIIVQSILVSIIYGTSTTVSTLFYICVLLVLVPIGALLTGAQIKKELAILLAQFADVPSVTTDLLSATAAANGRLTLTQKARDEAAAGVTEAQGKLEQTKTDLTSLQKALEEKKNTEAVVFGYIIRVRATGDLNSARDQMTAFLAKFPNGALVNQAKAQLDTINQELAEQKQSGVSAAEAAAQARLDLIARASHGEVTLEEMRHVLLGKARDDVSALFGKPTSTGTDRWDYSRQMLVDPQTNQKSGLTVYFSEGTVLSLDYYRGN